MATTENDPLTPAGFFLLRTPHLPVDAFHRWGAGLAAATDDTSVAGAREALRARLAALLEEPGVREAIYVASNSLSQRISKWLAKPEGKDGEKVEQALVRYFARMAGRATPFGLFAGFSIGTVGSETRLQVAARTRLRRHVRLDMEYVVALAEALEKNSEVRNKVVYQPSRDLYEIAGRIHYPELAVEGEHRYYRLTAVVPTEGLRQALARCENGAHRDEIARALEGDDATAEQTQAFVDELIDARILASSLTPAVTGPDPLGSIAPFAAVEGVRARLAAMAEAPIGAPAALYDDTARSLEGLPAKIDRARLFQVDMTRPAEATLGPREIEEIARGVRALHALTPDAADLGPFVAAFSARYGEREVPLTVALDEEVGVGLSVPGGAGTEPTPLLRGLGLRAAPEPWREGPAPMRDELLLRKLERAWRARADAIQLDDADLAPLARVKRDPLPTSLAAMASVLAGGRIVLHSWIGASAARLLGRFCAWDERLTDMLRAHLRQEEAACPDAVFAEIAHMPDHSRSGNVLLRPLLREYEIAFCGKSGADPKKTISLSDLTLCVRNERVVLYSTKLGREVVPRLGSAHNTRTRQLPAYRFLAALQGQGVTVNGVFSWGPYSGATSLPRVEYGRLILAPRQWQLDEATLASLAQETPGGRFRAAAAMRERLGLPRLVGLQDADNILPTDLENSLSVDALIGTVKGRGGARLVELFHDPADQGATGPDGAYVNEIVVPFLRATAPRPSTQRRSAPSAVRRTFAPGSEWCGAVIECPSGAADALIRDVVSPVVGAATRHGTIDRWFYTRETEPEHHVLVHAHGAAERLGAELVPALERALEPHLESGRARRFSLVPYVRALETFGEGIELVEQVFHADSEAAALVVRALRGVPEGRERWGWTLLGMHRMLVDLGCDLGRRTRITETAVKNARPAPALEHAIGARFRGERAFVEALVDGRGVPPGVHAALEARSRVVQRLAKRLRRSDALFRALVLAWVRRVIKGRPREHALVLNALLARHYASLAARERQAERGRAGALG